MEFLKYEFCGRQHVACQGDAKTGEIFYRDKLERALFIQLAVGCNTKIDMPDRVITILRTADDFEVSCEAKEAA